MEKFYKTEMISNATIYIVRLIGHDKWCSSNNQSVNFVLKFLDYIQF